MISCAKASSPSSQAGRSISSVLTQCAPNASARMIARVSRGIAASGFISGLCPEMETTEMPWRAQISRINSGSSSIENEWK
jgi:hypothetical protein